MGDYLDACVRLDRPRSGESPFSSHELTSSSAALGLSGPDASTGLGLAYDSRNWPQYRPGLSFQGKKIQVNC